MNEYQYTHSLRRIVYTIEFDDANCGSHFYLQVLISIVFNVIHCSRQSECPSVDMTLHLILVKGPGSVVALKSVLIQARTGSASCWPSFVLLSQKVEEFGSP